MAGAGAGLRINYTKGLSMKKIMVMALALMTAAVLATGCAGIGALGKERLWRNSVMIEKGWQCPVGIRGNL